MASAERRRHAVDASGFGVARSRSEGLEASPSLSDGPPAALSMLRLAPSRAAALHANTGVLLPLLAAQLLLHRMLPPKAAASTLLAELVLALHAVLSLDILSVCLLAPAVAVAIAGGGWPAAVAYLLLVTSVPLLVLLALEVLTACPRSWPWLRAAHARRPLALLSERLEVFRAGGGRGGDPPGSAAVRLLERVRASARARGTAGRLRFRLWRLYAAVREAAVNRTLYVLETSALLDSKYRNIL